MKNLIYLIAVLISGLCTNISEAQSLSVPADGKDFYLGFILPSYNSVADAQVSGYYGAYLLISSYEDNKASVSYFDKTTGIETPGTVYSMAERTGIQVPLNLQYTLMDSVGDAPEFGAIHIKSKRPINVEFFSTGACSGGSYLGLSTAALGTKYVVASYNDNPGTGALFGLAYGPTSIEHSHGCFEIVAAFDSTRVTITPNATTMKGHIGVNSGANSTGIPVPYTVTLRRGQCYFVKSGSSDNTVDISGSIIESSKPVAVLGAHENAFLGSVNGKTLEGRDFMVEQMVPVDNWDTTGYVSIPMKDSQPQDVNLYPGYGENYRVYSYDDAVTHAECFQAGVANPAAMLSAKYQHPTPELPDIINPVEFRSTDGRKFSVMLYDDRNVAMQNPYPAPSMMTIVPMSHWRTSFLWYVPANKFEQMQDYFVNILAPIADLNNSSGVMASFNGGTIKPIKQVMTLDAQWTNIPNHPELVGARFKIYPGSYYATGPHPFMVYNYGFRGLDPNNDIGDFEGDDFFFSYAAPSGMTMGTGSAHIRVSIDRYCSSWNVCLHDSTFGLAGQGIKMIMLLDDARGDYFKPGKQYFNTRLDDVLDPNHTGEIDLDGNDSNICFTVNINRPFDSAYAPLFISDALGNATTIDLVYSPPNVSLSPDSGSYLELPLSTDSCMKYVFKNNGKPGSGAFNLQTADLVLKGPSFRVIGTVPRLPALVAPGDSLVLTVCFSPSDTTTVRDTVLLTNDCFTQPIPLVGSGVIPQILASDHDFGFVLVDSTKCDTVGIRNVGKTSLILTTQWILSNITKFGFMDSALLPITLNPGEVTYLTFCYTPHSTAGDSGVMY
ncbi:MAG: hypothetical protein Q8896_11680, partial [Bacteroidota bacterium]|nr:hypothetical protein [Bacteroidota bacterium]